MTEELIISMATSAILATVKKPEKKAKLKKAMAKIYTTIGSTFSGDPEFQALTGGGEGATVWHHQPQFAITANVIECGSLVWQFRVASVVACYRLALKLASLRNRFAHPKTSENTLPFRKAPTWCCIDQLPHDS
jgi:hypothetical protein